MPDTILGLDIGNRSIKAVKVTGGMKGYLLSEWAEVKVEPESGIAEGLQELSEKMALAETTCIASFRPDQVSFRNLKMPFKDRKKIAQTVGFELEPMLPFPVDSIITDHLTANHSEETRVLSASVEEEVFAGFLSALTTQNLDPEVVDIGDVSAAVQYAGQEAASENALFIDMGSDITSLVLLHDGEVVLVRALHFGGASITKAIAEKKGISWEEAEALKCGADAEGLSTLTKPLITSFCQQIQNTLHAFRFELMTEVTVERILLSGGAALLPGLPEMLQDDLELPVELADLARHKGIELPEGAASEWNAPLMNTALGLAIRDQRARKSFNLRVGKFAKQRKYEQLKKELGRVGIYVLIAFVVLSGRFFTDYYVLNQRHNGYEKEITSIFKKTLPSVTRIVDPVRQLEAAINQTRGAMRLPQESAGGGAAIELLRDLFVNIPRSVSLDVDTLTLDQKRIRLKGHTDTFNSVDKIKNGLSRSSYFTSVSIASAQLDRSGDNIRFELLMEQP